MAKYDWIFCLLYAIVVIAAGILTAIKFHLEKERDKCQKDIVQLQRTKEGNSEISGTNTQSLTTTKQDIDSSEISER